MNTRERVRKWGPFVIIGLVVIAVGIYLGVLFLGGRQGENTGFEVPEWTPGTDITVPPPPPPTASATPTPVGCQPQKPITPVRFAIERMGISSQVLSLGYDENGAAGAPPDEDARSVAWLNAGPKPGSAKGHVVMSAHTYHLGRAIGNDLYDADTGLRKGDIIKISDNSGYTVCYRYRDALKVWVADYDKAPSNVLYDDEGASLIALVVCWDWDWSARHSKSRIIFYADPVTP